MGERNVSESWKEWTLIDSSLVEFEDEEEAKRSVKKERQIQINMLSKVAAYTTNIKVSYIFILITKD